MSEAQKYPKRLIEVDLPIRKVSAHSRREKSIRHGHISTLHIWWARRPLAACRAVACATLWPDPADPLCPPAFTDAATEILCEFAEQVRTTKQLMELTAENWSLWRSTEAKTFRRGQEAGLPLRGLLLAFIADFANWDAATVPQFITAASRLTEAAQRALSPDRPTRPFVLDPFCGGGAIPLEALRVGADPIVAPPTSGPTHWTFEVMPQGNLQSFRATVRSEHPWLTMVTTATTALTPGNTAPAQISTQGQFASPRGCTGTFGSVGTAQATRIDATFNGTDCQQATFAGTVVLVKE